jgi:hypothetical protein
LTGALGLSAGVAIAGDYQLDWFAYHGGGVTACIGNHFKLAGTSGQLGANVTAMTGGDYELAGGFWPGVVSQRPPKVPGLLEVLDELVPSDTKSLPPP